MLPISVIVPIFNQPELVEQCIESVLSAHVESPFKLCLVNDASTDSKIDELLRKYSGNEKIECLANEKNQGFTRTVNRGIRAAGQSHPLLLNSDTIVYDHWLDVLVSVMRSEPKVASVMPMTNQNGSHISCYPNNRWAKESTLEISDREIAQTAYEECRDLKVKVHTGGGFCLLLNRHCVDEIGTLDEEKFPRGYGEESDFCYRASYLGWRHYVAGGAFVTHLHGQSFGEEKNQLMEAMLPVFRQLHPSQPTLDSEFRERDPVHMIRRSLDIGRMKRLLGGSTAIHVVKDRDDGKVLEYPYLETQVISQSSIALKIQCASSEFPNIEPYVLPQDGVRLVCDLSAAGLNHVIISNELKSTTKIFDILQSILSSDLLKPNRDGEPLSLSIQN